MSDYVASNQDQEHDPSEDVSEGEQEVDCARCGASVPVDDAYYHETGWYCSDACYEIRLGTAR